MTQAASSMVAPRLPLMLVRATLTIDVSISSRIAAEITVTTMIHFVNPFSAIDATRSSPVCVSHSDHNIGAHARTQRMCRIGTSIQLNPYRQPLRHLNEVAG